MALGSSQACFPENFEDLDTRMAILVLVEKFLRQTLFSFVPSTVKSFTTMMHFVCIFSIYAYLRRTDHFY